jgi:hypothetical protein
LSNPLAARLARTHIGSGSGTGREFPVTVGLVPSPVPDALCIGVAGTVAPVASAAGDRVGRGKEGRARTREVAGHGP